MTHLLLGLQFFSNLVNIRNLTIGLKQSIKQIDTAIIPQLKLIDLIFLLQNTQERSLDS